MTRRDDRKPGRRGLGIALGTLLVLATVTTTAVADPPEIDGVPIITGTPQVGNTLQAGADYEGNPSWRWLRCSASNPSSCSQIPDATTTTYAVVEADSGMRLRVLLTVRYRGDTESELSQPTDVVTAAPVATPTPSPSPSPEPSPSPSPEPSPSPSPQPEATVTPQPAASLTTRPPVVEVLEQQAVRVPRMISPAPLVRIRGRLTRTGAHITLLTVRAPRGARIKLRCFGRGCPAKRWAATASLTRIRRFQGVLPGGTRLVISVTKRGRIGKHTTIVIRRGAAPTRRDRCLVPGSSRPVACSRVAT